MDEQELRLNNDLFFVRSLIEHLGRQTRNRRGDVADAVAEAFRSPTAPLLDDYNGSFFYEAPANVLVAHMTAALE